MLKFRISTGLLVLALVGMSLGWYVDRNSRRSITGAWRGPEYTLPLSPGSYSTTLRIRPDGTFEKIQDYGYGTKSITFSGTYTARGEGLFLFHIYNVNRTSDDGGGSVSSSVHQTFLCRCAIDPPTCLVITQISGSPEPELDLTWESYHRITKR